MRLTTKESMAVEYLSKNTFKGARFIDGLYMVEFDKQEMNYNKKNIRRNERPRPLKANHDEVSLRRRSP